MLPPPLTCCTFYYVWYCTYAALSTTFGAALVLHFLLRLVLHLYCTFYYVWYCTCTALWYQNTFGRMPDVGHAPHLGFAAMSASPPVASTQGKPRDLLSSNGLFLMVCPEGLWLISMGLVEIFIPCLLKLLNPFDSGQLPRASVLLSKTDLLLPTRPLFPLLRHTHGLLIAPRIRLQGSRLH